MDSLKWQNYWAKASKLQQMPGDRINYCLSTSAPLKDNFPSDGKRAVSEMGPYCRSGSLLFDALFALAWQEAHENQVNRISDWSFESEGIEAFETGKKWNYIWTRDTAYSAHLGLGIVSASRMLNSLNFKLSPLREHLLTPGKSARETLQIIQDTGSGGSWPISTDRVSWTLGADALMPFLKKDIRDDFLRQSFIALKNTIEMDRAVVFDHEDGLYRGEQSFLDWREQTYPQWTANDTLPIAMSKALSTNICHYRALQLAAKWGRELKQNEEMINRFERWALELKNSINAVFWDEHAALYRSIFLTPYVNKPLKKFDLLGNSLAIIFEIASKEQSIAICSHYPHTLAGAPVVHPQLLDIPIYHNRAIWPFVSTYALDAAIKVKNTAAIESHILSLIRGAAFNLSNMENFECNTLSPDFKDLKNNQLSGPVVNSHRQLWSVAGYIKMVLSSFFGVHFIDDLIHFYTCIPLSIIEMFFLKSRSIQINKLRWKEKELTIILKIPEDVGSYDKTKSYIEIESLLLNQIELKEHVVNFAALLETNQIVLKTKIQTHQDAALFSIVKNDSCTFAPPTPLILEKSVTAADQITVHFATSTNKNLRVIRNGQNWRTITARDELELSQLRPGDQVSFIEIQGVEESHPSMPFIFMPITASTPLTGIENISASDLEVAQHAKMGHFYQGLLAVEKSGRYRLELGYKNLGPINTGITAAMRELSIYDQKTNERVGHSIICLPHHDESIEINYSMPLWTKLEAATSYRFEIKLHPNMSYFAHFEKYTKRGGKSGADNNAQLIELRLSRENDN